MTDVQHFWPGGWAQPTATLPPWSAVTDSAAATAESFEPAPVPTTFVASEPYHDRQREGRLGRILAPLVLLLAIAAVAAFLVW